MGKNDLVDLVRLPASVPPRIAQLEGCQSEGRPSARRLHVDVGWVVFARPEEEPVWTGPKNRGHADLVDGSTGGHHGFVRFTLAYVRNPAVIWATERDVRDGPDGSRRLGLPHGRDDCRDLDRIEIRAQRGRRYQSSGSGAGEPAANLSPRVSGTAFVGMPRTTVLPDDPSS